MIRERENLGCFYVVFFLNMQKIKIDSIMIMVRYILGVKILNRSEAKQRMQISVKAPLT